MTTAAKPKGRVSFAARRMAAEANTIPALPLDQPFNLIAAIRVFRRPMSARELAPLLGMSDDRLYAITRDGKIPRLIIPGSSLTRYDPSQIADWIARHNPGLGKIARAY